MAAADGSSVSLSRGERESALLQKQQRSLSIGTLGKPTRVLHALPCRKGEPGTAGLVQAPAAGVYPATGRRATTVATHAPAIIPPRAAAASATVDVPEASCELLLTSAVARLVMNWEESMPPHDGRLDELCHVAAAIVLTLPSIQTLEPRGLMG